MLVLYRSGAIKVTDKFRSIMMSMLMGVVIAYGLTFVLGLFGVNVGIVTGNSLMAIGLNILIAGIAAFSLLLDFDMIERGSSENWPGYMEWYSAFGLMVTIVWLYLELLKLLSRFASRD
jgi:Predicted membrane protein